MASKGEIEDLFEDAESEGLDKDASGIMIANLDAVALAGCQGTDVDLIPTDEVTLVTAIHDGSGSMAGDRNVVVESYAEILDALRGSKQAESILVSSWIFNTERNLVHGFVPVAEAPGLEQAYYPDGSTALYDTVLAGLTGLVAYGQQLKASGVRVKNIVVVFSDGADNASKNSGEAVKKIAATLLVQETYILAYVGFGGGFGVLDKNEAKGLADEIGFPDVIVAGNSASDIRRIFRQVSKSIISASQSVVKSGGFFAAP